MSDQNPIQSFNLLRAQRPSIPFLRDWYVWLAATGQAIKQFPTINQRWALVVMIAHDLGIGFPGIELGVAYALMMEVAGITDEEILFMRLEDQFQQEEEVS